MWAVLDLEADPCVLSPYAVHKGGYVYERASPQVRRGHRDYITFSRERHTYELDMLRHRNDYLLSC